MHRSIIREERFPGSATDKFREKLDLSAISEDSLVGEQRRKMPMTLLSSVSFKDVCAKIFQH